MNQAEEFLKKWYPTVKMNDKWDRELPIISWDDCLEIMQTYTDQQLQLHNVVGRSEQLCSKCGSDDLFDIDDHYTKCQDCGFTFVGA